MTLFPDGFIGVAPITKDLQCVRQSISRSYGNSSLCQRCLDVSLDCLDPISLAAHMTILMEFKRDYPRGGVAVKPLNRLPHQLAAFSTSRGLGQWAKGLPPY